MKPRILPSDLEALAAAIHGLPPDQALARAEQILQGARCAALHVRRTRRAHPQWGDGSIAMAAGTRPGLDLNDPEALIAVSRAAQAMSRHVRVREPFSLPHNPRSA